ncbi:hypothetical protein SAMN05216259_11729 [Actinacidiphila guanduensis]|uniref:Uncharacterized protein n=1 Tax=Actinacidiphila guanduensis TaxID=310781 RepID=A0A1H0PWN4_9ACTN|nr:hypothetical protein SAMN05216259_11729 [Actinacidiphila guanduensis]
MTSPRAPAIGSAIDAGRRNDPDGRRFGEDES